LIRNNVGKMDVQIVQGYLGAEVVKEWAEHKGGIHSRMWFCVFSSFHAPVK
jgi:hypothetical protein